VPFITAAIADASPIVFFKGTAAAVVTTGGWCESLLAAPWFPFIIAASTCFSALEVFPVKGCCCCFCCPLPDFWLLARSYWRRISTHWK
jgi:hypothetical protein